MAVASAGYMQVCTLSQTTMPTSHHAVFYRSDALPAAQPTASKHHCSTEIISSIYMSGSIFAQPLSKSSLVYLLVWHPPLHTPYISSPNHCLLFAAHVHTIATCFAVVPRLYRLILVCVSTLFGTLSSALMLHIATYPSSSRLLDGTSITRSAQRSMRLGQSLHFKWAKSPICAVN